MIKIDAPFLNVEVTTSEEHTAAQGYRDIMREKDMRIVAKHGGFLRIDTADGKGATIFYPERKGSTARSTEKLY